MRLTIFAGLVLTLQTSITTHAESARKFSIKSSLDSFELVVQSRTSGTVDGKASALRSLADLWPVLENPLGNACPALKGKADAVVTENGISRSIYVKQGIVTDGKGCMNVGGEGLLFFPLHREFLIGKPRDSIRLNSPLKIFRQGIKVLDLRKERGQWVTDNQQQLLNWDFIERFENSLRDFDVRLRVQPEIVAGKPKMIVQSSGQTYEFYKVTKVMWAVKKPGYAWLEASDDWSFWYDFEQGLIEDRFAPEIRELQKADATPEQRAAALLKMEGAWTRNLRDVYHKILLNPAESEDFHRRALQALRQKPSVETAGVMVDFLNRSNKEDLKRIAGQILKTQNPKGPLYKPSLSSAEKNKVLEFWNNWWKTQKEK